jgi:hypothetical protein
MPIFPATWEPETGGSQFEASLGKKLARANVKNKPDVEFHSLNLSYSGGEGRSISVQY